MIPFPERFYPQGCDKLVILITAFAPLVKVTVPVDGEEFLVPYSRVYIGHAA
jgi:hypothetical protein